MDEKLIYISNDDKQITPKITNEKILMLLIYTNQSILNKKARFVDNLMRNVYIIVI